ncbi:MAG TPA: DUF3352 domain-containing protein [Solirubrobacteraceae bacterium]|nr:DUF3352 domain-containing protein [Solirubrobacteraceae bacterium]
MPLDPTADPQRRPRRVLAASLAAATVLASAACGSSHSSGTTIDPASAVPATAPLYASATVRPDGALQSAARAAGRALTQQADPYLRLLGALQTPGSPALDFKRDVAPWLGPRAGIFLGSTGGASEADVSRLLSLLQQGLLGESPATGGFPFAAHGVDGAFVLDSSDATKARSFIATQARRAGAHAAAYRGTSYQATAGGIAFGIVDRLVVIGSESALHGVIDTTAGGPSLARATAYSTLIGSTPSGTLAHVYANAGAPGRARKVPAQGLTSVVSLLAGGRPVNVSLVPSGNSIAVDADALAAGTTPASGGLLSSSSEASRAMGELPGESWLAVGLGDVGSTLGSDVQALQGLASLGGSPTGPSPEAQSSLNVKGLIEGILAPIRALGADTPAAKRDFASWMGSAGLFAAGTGLLELKGGVVIDSKNAALSRAAVGKLAAQLRKGGGSVQPASIPGTEAAVAARLRGLPVVLDIASGRSASGQSKFVIGIGEASVEAALNPSSKLSGAASYGATAAALGAGFQPSISVDFPTLLGLLEGIGLNEDPTISPFVPYLRSLTTLTGGGRSLGGGIERFRLVLGLQGG